MHNNILSFARATRTYTAPGLVPCPDQTLSELLALHEEMIVQLHLEHLAVVGTADFLTSMIEQHEKASALLRALLEEREPDIA